MPNNPCTISPSSGFGNQERASLEGLCNVLVPVKKRLQVWYHEKGLQVTHVRANLE